MTRVPPFWIKVPDAILDDPELSPSVKVTVAKLLRAARPFRYQRTPELTIDEIMEICGLERRTAYYHLSRLRQSGHFLVTSPGSATVIWFCAFLPKGEPPFEPECKNLHSLSVVVHDRQESNLSQTEQQHSESVSGFDSGGGVGGSAEVCTACAKDCTDDEYSACWHAVKAELVELYGSAFYADGLLVDHGVGECQEIVAKRRQEIAGRADELAAELAEVFGSQAFAAEMVAQYGVQRCVRQLEHYRWKDARGGGVGAGWLREAIVEDWKVPRAAEDRAWVWLRGQSYTL